MKEGVPKSRRVCPSMRRCSPVWECVPQCGRVCPSLERCSLVREGVNSIDKYVQFHGIS